MAVQNNHSRSRINRKGRYQVVRVKLTDGGPLNNGPTGAAQSAGSKTLSMGGGPGKIVGISLTYSSSNASGVLTIKENNSSGATLFTYTGDTNTTNASTGEFLTACTDGLTVTNTTSADVPGLHFARGLYMSYASATVGDTVIVRLLVDTQIQYVKRTITMVGSNGSATAKSAFYFDRPGRLSGIRVGASASATATLVLKADNDVNGSGIPGSNAGATIFTATSFGTTAIASAAGTLCPATLVSGGVDEVNGAVTVGYGLPFMHGFNANFTNCNSAEALVAEFWIEV